MDHNDQRATAHLARKNLAKRKSRRPVPGFDDQGDLILRVPLDDRGERFAIVYPADWIAMQEAGCDGLWSCNDNGDGRLRVKTRRPLAHGKPLDHVMVARFILDLGDDARVRYRNGDPFDLRRVNLDHTGNTASPTARPARYNARKAVKVSAERRKKKAA
jgi:hypothetical protein